MSIEAVPSMTSQPVYLFNLSCFVFFFSRIPYPDDNGTNWQHPVFSHQNGYWIGAVERPAKGNMEDYDVRTRAEFV